MAGRESKADGRGRAASSRYQVTRLLAAVQSRPCATKIQLLCRSIMHTTDLHEHNHSTPQPGRRLTRMASSAPAPLPPVALPLPPPLASLLLLLPGCPTGWGGGGSNSESEPLGKAPAEGGAWARGPRATWARRTGRLVAWRRRAARCARVCRQPCARRACSIPAGALACLQPACTRWMSQVAGEAAISAASKSN